MLYNILIHLLNTTLYSFTAEVPMHQKPVKWNRLEGKLEREKQNK